METPIKELVLNPDIYSIVFLKDGIPVSPQIDMTGFRDYKMKTLGISLDTWDRLHVAKMNGITDFTHYALPNSLNVSPFSLEGMDIKTFEWVQFNPKTFEIMPNKDMLSNPLEEMNNYVAEKFKDVPDQLPKNNECEKECSQLKKENEELLTKLQNLSNNNDKMQYLVNRMQDLLECKTY
jgi:hypothetical protein